MPAVSLAASVPGSKCPLLLTLAVSVAGIKFL